MSTNLKNLYIKNLIILTFMSIPWFGMAQIRINNASFVDDPSDAMVPMGWFACQPGSTPDILPGFWGVYDEASDGETYMGLITRDDNSYESIGQRLPFPLKKGECYNLDLDLAKSDNYVGYNDAIHLRIWVSDEKCELGQLIFDSPQIKHNEWDKYIFEFIAKTNSKYITIEAYQGDSKKNIKGNILVDNISIIRKCNRA